jgi:proteasome lid subunit RPN8/RPN11
VADTGLYRLYLSDSTKQQRTTVVELDDLIGGAFTRSTDTVTFRFRGGHPPYRLIFLHKGSPLIDRAIGMDTIWRVSNAELLEIVGSPGAFGLQLTDEQRSVTWNFGNRKLQINRPSPKSYMSYAPFLVGGGALLLIFLLFIRSTGRKRRRAAIRKNLAPAAAPERSAAIQSSRFPDGSRQRYRGESLAGKFRITRRPRRDASTAVFNPDERPSEFLGLPMDEHWDETSISTILFGNEAIGELDGFLRRENTSKIVSRQAGTDDADWERNQPIPEIGGMLMGQYRPESDSTTYRVSVEKFVPLRARVQNMVKVEIDPMSLARDLSLAQDENADLTVVGWFHTHPGHGLFLSQPDLKVQYGHFRAAYHFAMEIDSLTERLDTALFTYRLDGAMNNVNNRRPETEWFSWAEIARFSRRNTLL